MKTSFTQSEIKKLTSALSKSISMKPESQDFIQPIHVVYGGAHLFSHKITEKLGTWSLKTFDTYCTSPKTMAKIFGFRDKELAQALFERVRQKLLSEPVEDYRIDFEDGFGLRPDGEEDAEALRCAEETLRGLDKKTLPRSLGLRVKALHGNTANRSFRTLDLYLSAFLKELPLKKGLREIPFRLVVTIPKVTREAQVKALSLFLNFFEKKYKLAKKSISIEVMVESPEILFDTKGVPRLPKIIESAQDRPVAIHFGAYDYTAALGISGSSQTLDHPACDFARHIMQVSLSDFILKGRTTLCDGANHIIPMEPHKNPIRPKEIEENRAAVMKSWISSWIQIQNSLKCGYFQGWDLHPGQIPVRLMAVYFYFLKDLKQNYLRLKKYQEQENKASLLGQSFDDAASAKGLKNFFRQGLRCGAFRASELVDLNLA